MNNPVETLPALLRREWQEHSSAFTWGPAVVLALIVLAGLVMLLFEGRFEAQITERDRVEIHERLEVREDVGVLEGIAALALDAAGSTDRELELKLDGLLNALSIPFYLVFIVIAFIACVACVHDERKDQSILFWKSMPVSDTASVISKIVFIAWVAPVVTILAISVAQLFAVTVVSLAVEDGMGGRIWSNSGLLLRPVRLLVGYFLNGLWILPAFAWVMCVSSYVAKVPFLWVIGIPWVAGLLERILFGTTYLGDAVTGHIQSGTLPVPVEGSTYTFSNTFAVLARPGMWGGILLGAGLLYLTIFFRGRNNVI